MRESRSGLPHQGQRASSEMLTEKEAAKLLGFSYRTLQKWRGRGEGPLFLKITARGAIRYRRADLFEWTKQRLRRSTSDDGSP